MKGYIYKKRLNRRHIRQNSFENAYCTPKEIRHWNMEIYVIITHTKIKSEKNHYINAEYLHSKMFSWIK